jgi:hypothetical protein
MAYGPHPSSKKSERGIQDEGTGGTHRFSRQVAPASHSQVSSHKDVAGKAAPQPDPTMTEPSHPPSHSPPEGFDGRETHVLSWQSSPTPQSRSSTHFSWILNGQPRASASIHAHAPKTADRNPSFMCLIVPSLAHHGWDARAPQFRGTRASVRCDSSNRYWHMPGNPGAGMLQMPDKQSVGRKHRA